MIQLTKGTNVLDVNLSDFSGAGQDVVQNGSFDDAGNNLIQNGGFDQIGSDVVNNGGFSEIGTDVITNGDFTEVYLGSELVDNGDFSTGLLTPWTAGSSGDGVTPTVVSDAESGYGAKISNGALGDNSYIYQTGKFVLGKRYKVSYRIVSNTIPTNRIRLQDYETLISTVGTHHIYVWGNGVATALFKRASSDALVNIVITDISIKEASLITNGNFSATSSELVTNGDFTTDTDWLKEAGWTISGGEANFSGGSANKNIRQNIGITNSKSYKIQFTVSSISAGEVAVRFGGMAGVSEITATAIGTYTGYITANSSANGDIFIEDNDNAFVGSVSSISVKELGEDWTFETGWSINENGAYYDGTGGANRNIRQNIGITNGKSYKIVYTVSTISAGEVAVRFGGMAGIDEITATAIGTDTGYITPNSSANGEVLIEDNNNAFVGSISSISIEELGEDWTQGIGWSIGDSKAISTQALGGELITNGNFDTTAGNIILNPLFTDTSAEILVNGDFATGLISPWLPTGTINVVADGANYGVQVSGGSSYIIQATAAYTLPIILGNSYKFTYRIVSNGGGSLKIAYPDTPLDSSVGTRSVYFVATSTSFIIQTNEASTDVVITDMNVQELGADWTLGGGWSIGEGEAVADGIASTSNMLFQDSGLVVGKNYKISFSSNRVGGTLFVKDGDFYSDTTIYTLDAGFGSAVNTFYITWAGAELGFYAYDYNGSITNVSVELLGEDWTLGGGWSIGEDEAIADGSTSTSNMLFQDSGLVVGKTYKISFSSNRVSGTLFVKDGDFYSDNTIYTLISGTGSAVNTFYVTWVGVGGELGFYAYNYNGSITNISVEEIATSYLTQAGVLTADKTWMVIYSAVVSAGTVSATEWGSVISATATIIDYVKVGATTDFRMVNIDGYFEGSVTGIFAYLVDPLGYWTLQSGWAFSSDKVTYDAVTNSRYISQLLTFELEKSYKIQFTISGGTARLKFTNESGVDLFTNIGVDNYAPDSYTLYGKGIASTELRIYAYNNSGGEAFSITDISVERLDPNDYWTTGTGAVIGTDELIVNGGDGFVAYQPSIVNATGYYIIKFLVSNYGGGNVFGRVANVNGEAVTSDGLKTQYIQGSSTADVGVYCSGSFIGDVTDIVVKQLDTNNRWVTFADPDSKSLMKVGEVDLEIDLSGNNCGVYQTGLIKPNKLYIVTINMKATAALEVEIAASLGTAVSEVIGTTALTTSYVEYSFEYVTPFAVDHDLQIHRFLGSGKGETISIDYVSMNGVDENQWINDPTWNPFATSLVYVPTLTDESTNNSKQFTLDTSIKDGGWNGRSLHGQVIINESAVEDPANGIINLEQPNFLEGFYQVEIRGYLGTFYRILGKGMAHLERASTEDGYNRFEAYNDSVTYKAYEE